jgi:hypothetical protein
MLKKRSRCAAKALLVGSALLLPTASAVRSQTPAWSVVSLEQLDLWYHGLAVVGFQGFAPLPMYSTSYADNVRAEKERLGIYPTPLDTLAGRFRRAFETDSAFELFHFLPVYFAASDRAAMLAALRAATADGNPQSMLEQFGASVVAAMLTTDRQRRVVNDFADALEAEWELFLRDYLEVLRGELDPLMAETGRYWNDDVARQLADYLGAGHLTGGILVISPPLGAEGRIFTGMDGNDRDNVIVVGYPSGSTPRKIVAHAVRESCFPRVSALVARLAFSADRQMAERAASRGAVRCGSIVLETYFPELAAEYRRVFLEYAPNVNTTTTFESAFPVDRQLLTAITNEVTAR